MGQTKGASLYQWPCIVTNLPILSQIWLLLIVVVVVVSIAGPNSVAATTDSSAESQPHYLAIGVSGGLQDGFPDHVKMDYVSSAKNKSHRQEDSVPAVFVGRAMVRGVKAYLDVMQEGWRQYTPKESGTQPLINSVNIVSGCHEHANQYWIYLVDTRQALAILNNEPRFLSITPDTALIDLQSNETDDTVRQFALHEIQKQGPQKDRTKVALPIVVATWYNADSFVPSPPIRTHADGTNVTNFPESLALWANVNDSDRTAGCDNDSAQECLSEEGITLAHERYWNGIQKAIRQAEDERSRAIVDSVENQFFVRGGRPPFQCRKKTRLGVGPDQVRINYALSSDELLAIFDSANYDLDLKASTLRSR